MIHPLIECIETREEHAHRHYGCFRIGPLLPGQGITLGNGLRRTLLSDLPGIAITKAQMEGVLHEFCTLEGVRESVLEILLNLRGIVLAPTSPWVGPATAYLDVRGPAQIHAGDLQLPPSSQVVDPSQYIATLMEGGHLEIKLTIDQGRGRRSPQTPVPQSSLSELTPSLDSLGIESVFMPVTQVNYKVETQGAHENAVELIMMEVWTNGSMGPRQAIHEGAVRMIELLEPFREPSYLSPLSNPILETTQEPQGIQGGEEVEKQGDGQVDVPKVAIESLQLPPRPFNCLKRAQIYTIADLLQYSREDLLKIKNFGNKSANEVVEALETRFHLSLPGQSSNQARRL
uniref:DNA-directed RNA polymerase subunit alpha n=1 Tax=Nephroselmis pyriformis TaxID=156128 RepID=A0A8A2H8N9_9CHLO|nr:RNA polymerase alpha subunit [Nephroselmis pyriformis]QSV37291.1 RNA polymerase alpha subunit [Nephroselmis pyriformis]